ncbi:MAG: M23 family metallopeptidase [Bacteroidales bacterium]|nr:M23 family metallopeptidase [Bacteroidales bacterium]
MIFRKKKYRFNPNTLLFEEIRIDKKRRFRRISLYLLGILFFILISGFLLNHFLGSPEARILEKQVAVLNKQMQVLYSKGKHFSTALRNDVFPKDNHYRTILQMDTVPYTYRLAGSGGSAAADGISLNSNLTYQLNNLINKLDQQLQLQSGSFDILYKKALEHSTQLVNLPAIQPVSQNDLIMISSRFGVRSDPFFFFEQVHNGIDFVTTVGKNVYATGNGTVTFVQYSRTGYGNEIVIDHMFGFGSRYGHLDTILVKHGEMVKRGQVIGTVGQTGRATGPHLHYEVMYENKAVNPSFYYDSSLTREEYAQIIQKANKDID